MIVHFWNFSNLINNLIYIKKENLFSGFISIHLLHIIIHDNQLNILWTFIPVASFEFLDRLFSVFYTSHDEFLFCQFYLVENFIKGFNVYGVVVSD
jgi:hypothetical protein